MARIVIAKRHPIDLTDADKAAARRVLFGVIDGLGEADRRKWRRLWQWLMDAEVGSAIDLYTRRARDEKFHGFHMRLETRFFEAQDCFITMEAFRDWLKTGAGFVDWSVNPRGEMVAVPRSTSYDALEQDDYEQFHLDCIAFLRTPRAYRALWPHLPDRQGSEMVETLLRSFER